MSSICIVNHYVPQFYLKNWSEDDTHVWMYRKILSSMKVPVWKKQAISGTAYEKHLYSRLQTSGLSDDFEHWLNEEVETPAKPVISRIIDGFEMSQSDKVVLARFFIAQYLRTPSFFFRNQAVIERSAIRALESSNSIITKIYEKAKSGQLDAKREPTMPLFHQPQVKVTQVSDSDTATGFYIDINTGRATWLSTIRRLVDVHALRIAGNNWQVIPAPVGMEWPTSDDPAICLQYNSPKHYRFDGGIDVKNATLMLPLGPNHLLFTEVGSTCYLNNLGYADQIKKELRQIILQHALLSVYCRTREKFLQEQCPPHVNWQWFDNTRKVMESWNDIHSSTELDFL